MERLLSERELHNKFDELTEQDISSQLTIHEYKIVGILSVLLILDNSKGIKTSLKNLKKAYRIGGMHINLIDRADDVLDGERGFERADNPEKFLNNWLNVLETGEIECNFTESERISYESCILFRNILSKKGKKKYHQKMSKVVECEKQISKENLNPEKEYRKHLKSAGVCLEALSIPLEENTPYHGNPKELRKIGEFFQIIDDIQDLEEDNYFPEKSNKETRIKMRSIQRELANQIGKGFSRKIILLFGKFMPIADDYINFKKLV